MKSMKILCAAVLLFTTFEAQAKETRLKCSSNSGQVAEYNFVVTVDPSRGVRSIEFTAVPRHIDTEQFLNTKNQLTQPRTRGTSSAWPVGTYAESSYTKNLWIFTCARYINTVSSEHYKLVYQIYDEESMNSLTCYQPDSSLRTYMTVQIDRSTGSYLITGKGLRIHGKCTVAGAARF